MTGRLTTDKLDPVKMRRGEEVPEVRDGNRRGNRFFGTKRDERVEPQRPSDLRADLVIHQPHSRARQQRRSLDPISLHSMYASM